MVLAQQRQERVARLHRPVQHDEAHERPRPGERAAGVGDRGRRVVEPEQDDLDRAVVDGVAAGVAGQVERARDRRAAAVEEVVLAQGRPQRRLRA